MKKVLFVIAVLCGICSAQTPYGFMPNPRLQFVDSNGIPLAGGFLFSYQAGTSTPLATYHLDTLGTITANTNPVILDSTGSAEVRLLPQAYKFVLQNSSGAQVWDVDQVEDVGQILFGQAVLLNPPGAALQTIAGPLAVTTINIGGGGVLSSSAQSGSGSLCMTTNCALATPSVNGITIPNSPGTYIQVPNASVTGTTVGTLTKFAAAVPAWTKRNDQSGSGSGSPQTATAFATSLTNPSLIIVLTSGPVGTFSVSDTAGNSYLDCGQGQIVFNASANGVQCFYALNTHTTGSNVVSFTSSGGGAMKLTATEWTGGAIVSPVDVLQNSGANASTGTGGAQNVSSGSATTTGADLIVGIAGVTAGTLTVGTGFTPSSTAGLEYLTQSGPGALAATWNDNTNNDSYAALMVAFRPYAGASSNAVIAATSDTNGIQGIAVSGAGTAGTAVIQQSGTVPCIFDGATNASDYVQISNTTGGDCHDTGSTMFPNPAPGQLIGHVLSTNSVAGTYNIELLGPEFQAGSAGARIICADSTPTSVSANTTSNQVMKTCAIPFNSLNGMKKTFRLTAQGIVQPGSGIGSNFSWGIGTTAALGTFVNLTGELASASPYTTATTITCTVNSTGSAGTMFCTYPSVVFSAGSPGISNISVTVTANLTGFLYVGLACSFSAGSTSNSCTNNLLTLEQLN